MHSNAQQAQILRILASTMNQVADVLDTSEPAVATEAPKSVRNTPDRSNGSRKMWARDPEEKRAALATVLGEFFRNGGVITREEFKAVARSVGYDTRGLASFSTTKVDLVQRDPADPFKRRLTEKGYQRYRAIMEFDLHRVAA